MSSDLKDGKKLTGSVFPEGAIDASGQTERFEALITPKALKKRFLFGISMKAPLTNEEITLSDLKDYIRRAIGQFEVDSKVLVMPVLKRHRLPFDPNLYQKFMWMEIDTKPIQKVTKLAICSAAYKDTPEATKQYPQGALIYEIPLEWVDTSYAAKGRIHVNPINPAFSAIGVHTSAPASGAAILHFIGQMNFVPAWWTVECVHGFCNSQGQVPVFLNECIGQLAAMMILDNLIPLFRTASQSLGVDGLSQSTSDLAYQLLTQKRQQLAEQYKENVKKVKAMTFNSFFVTNV